MSGDFKAEFNIKDLVPLIMPVADLVAGLIKRANQEGALTLEQRQKLADDAEVIFQAAASAPPPPPGVEP